MARRTRCATFIVKLSKNEVRGRRTALKTRGHGTQIWKTNYVSVLYF